MRNNRLTSGGFTNSLLSGHFHLSQNVDWPSCFLFTRRIYFRFYTWWRKKQLIDGNYKVALTCLWWIKFTSDQIGLGYIWADAICHSKNSVIFVFRNAIQCGCSVKILQIHLENFKTKITIWMKTDFDLTVNQYKYMYRPLVQARLQDLWVKIMNRRVS